MKETLGLHKAQYHPQKRKRKKTTTTASDWPVVMIGAGAFKRSLILHFSILHVYGRGWGNN